MMPPPPSLSGTTVILIDAFVVDGDGDGGGGVVGCDESEGEDPDTLGLFG